MPKINGTRKQRAAELYERLKRGPALGGIPGRAYSPEYAKAQYLLWVDSWILGDLVSLIPELRNINDQDEGGL